MYETDEQRERRAKAAKRKDMAAVAFGLVMLFLVIVVVPLTLVARVAAPCEYIDWMPVAEVPTRCLPGGNG